MLEVFGYPTQPSAGQLLIWTDNASRGDGGEGEGCVGRRRIRRIVGIRRIRS